MFFYHKESFFIKRLILSWTANISALSVPCKYKFSSLSFENILDKYTSFKINSSLYNDLAKSVFSLRNNATSMRNFSSWQPTHFSVQKKWFMRSSHLFAKFFKWTWLQWPCLYEVDYFHRSIQNALQVVWLMFWY